MAESVKAMLQQLQQQQGDAATAATATRRCCNSCNSNKETHLAGAVRVHLAGSPLRRLGRPLRLAAKNDAAHAKAT
jgi:hypothetical protein